MKLEMKPYEEKMRKAVSVYQENLSTIRAGRANANVLSKITVDYYGSATAINAMAAVSQPDARTLLIQPWDGGTLKAIEKAILTSDLGINPQNDGRSLRLIFPQLTEDRRREMTKQIAKMGEEAKVAVVPGDAFFMPNAVRFSYTDSMDRLQEGMERFGNVLLKIE